MSEAKYPQALDAIENLWSCHGDFLDRDIDEKKLETILRAAVRAASASAQQSYSIIVLDNRNAMKDLTGYAGSRALVFCADGTRLAAAAERLGMGGPGSLEMNSFLTWSVDALLAAQNACLAARALGIDSLFTNGIGRTGIEATFATLGLPERGCFPLITLILGYAAHARGAKKGRLSGAGIVHRNRYASLDADGLDAMISAYDDPDLNLGMTRAFASKGYAHYLEWFFKDWMSGFPSGMGDAAAERLRKSGFLA